MDGEHRNRDSAWPASGPSQWPPAEPGPEADTTHVYASSFGGRDEPGNEYWPGDGHGVAGGPGTPDRNRFGPGGSTRGSPGGPSRRIVLTSLGVAVLLAIGAGAIYSMNQPSGVASDVDTAVAPIASPSPTTPNAFAVPSTADTATPDVTVTVTTTARETGTSEAPSGYVDEPWSDPGLDFGTVVAVTGQGDKARITVHRQHFLIGDAAREYYDEHPDKEELDYAITDDGGKDRRYTVADDALVYGANLLGDGPNSHTPLTVSEFTTKARTLLDANTPLRMWMYRRTSSSSTVIYLAEQYIP